VLEKTPKPMGFSETDRSARAATRPSWAGLQARGGRPEQVPAGRARARPDEVLDPLAALVRDEDEGSRQSRDRTPIRPVVREWLMDLQVLGRSERTINWYEQKINTYLRDSGIASLEELTAFEFKRYLAELQGRELAANTVHGYFETLKAFANWAARETYQVDPGVLRARAPKVPQQEMETYTEAQVEALLQAAPKGWPQTAILTLLGTGMRVGELCALRLVDFEDDGEAAFLKIQRGKGGKFRRVPVSRRLRRELMRYLNRVRPDTATTELLVRTDGQPLRVRTVIELFQRMKGRVGFHVHAHKFRHTFATEYLRQGGDIERLRRILGHTTYVMVMRYVHLDKGDLYRDFDQRSPF
jgi:site-specific recombinase XerD